jgi:hypothetical protein
MSCLGPGYNPNPTRSWSRVQSQCTYDDGSNYASTIYIPQLRKYVPTADAAYELALLNKGNVLQYKNNSSNLTKQQKYAQISKSKWTNRTTTWATQSDKYTNMNTRMLKRVNAPNNITLDGVITTDPITPCPYNSGLPPSEIIVPNGGSLVCNIMENTCTGETIVTPARDKCHPTSDSDVPGPITLLCYNDNLPTYYPRQRYIMSNSGNKWPQGERSLPSGNSIPSSG